MKKGRRNGWQERKKGIEGLEEVKRLEKAHKEEMEK